MYEFLGELVKDGAGILTTSSSPQSFSVFTRASRPLLARVDALQPLLYHQELHSRGLKSDTSSIAHRMARKGVGWSPSDLNRRIQLSSLIRRTVIVVFGNDFMDIKHETKQNKRFRHD